MPLRIVQSKQNPRLKELRRALSRPGRDDRGLVGVEGLNLLHEALRAGLHVPCVFVAQEATNPLEGLAFSAATEVLMVPKAVLDEALSTEAPQPVAALAEPPDWTWAHLLRPHNKNSTLIVVLAGIQDPGNLGTILRSAEAFMANGVVCLPGTVSAWNPKAVRASAGSVFRLPQVSTTWEECFTSLHEAGVRLLTTSVHQTEPADQVNLTGPVAFLIGNEGNGVPEELACQADGRITVPCPGPVESLNAAVAASVLLYETRRQRRKIGEQPHQLRGSVR